MKFWADWKWLKEHFSIKTIFGTAPKVPVPFRVTIPIPIADGEIYVLLRVKIGGSWLDFFALGIKF